MSDGDRLGCPLCTGGTQTRSYLIGDGQPGVDTQVRSTTIECRFCSGSGMIDSDRIPDGDDE